MIQTKDISVTQASADGTNTFTFTLRVRENSVDIAKNSSNVTIEAILQQTDAGTCFINTLAGVSCAANGVSLFNSYRERTLMGSKERIFHTWTENMRHWPDGNLELSIQGRFWISGARDNQPALLEVRGTVPLTKISRVSAVGASDANIGSNTTIVIVPGSDDYSHSIRYTFGADTGYIAQDGSISQQEQRFDGKVISFPIPTAFYEQIPDQQKARCRLDITAYRDSRAVGTVETAFWVSADPELCRPLLEATVADGNEKVLSVTGDENTLVRFCSDALCRAQAQSRNGATVKSVTVNGLGMDEQLRIPQTETGVYTFIATDSRGFQTAVTVDKPLIPYILLTCNPVARRTAPTTGQVELTVTGNCYQGSLGQESNATAGAYRVNGGQWHSFEVQLQEGHTYSATLLLEGLDYSFGHVIEVKMEDKLKSVTATALVGRGIPVFDWGEDYFNFHVPVHFGAGVTGLT